MSTSTTIQVRIDSVTKAKAVKVLKDLGLDLSSAVKLFLTQVVNRKAIPFVALTENGYTEAQEKRFLRQASKEKLIGPFGSAKEMLDDILK